MIMLVCLPCCLLLSGLLLSLASASSVRLLHGLVLLPSGISGKMTATLDLTTIIAMLVSSFYRYVAYLSVALQASQIAMNL